MSVVLVASRYGPMLVPTYDRYITWSLAHAGVYSPAEFDQWRPYLPTDGVIVEVGANSGAHTLAFLASAPDAVQVVAYEPQRVLYHALAGTLALNGYTHRCTLHRQAVGAAGGVAHIPALDFGNVDNYGGVPLVGDGQGEPVPLVALDDQAFPGPVRFVKLDIEGGERAALDGALGLMARDRPVVVAEAETVERQRAIRDVLAPLGYTCRLTLPELGPWWPDVVSFNVLAVPEGVLPPALGPRVQHIA